MKEQAAKMWTTAKYLDGQAMIRRLRALQLTGESKANTLKVAEQFATLADWNREQAYKLECGHSAN
jgi:hypothetical protein